MILKDLHCLSGEVDFHQSCFTVDDKFEITHNRDGYTIRLNSSNENNPYVKRFKELGDKTSALTKEELENLLTRIYNK